MGLLPLVILVALVVLGFKSFKVVPQQEAHIVERLGKFHQTLNPGVEYSCAVFRPRSV